MDAHLVGAMGILKLWIDIYVDEEGCRAGRTNADGVWV